MNALFFEYLLTFRSNLQLSLRHKIAESGGPKRTRSMGRITGKCQVALLFQREPDS
jgi:hypothetical protein